MVDARTVFRTLEPHARTVASVFRLEWVPAIAKLPIDGLYSWRDVPYKAGSTHPKHTLDVYIPGRGPDTPFPRPSMPVVMFWHGGAWRRGDKDWHGALYGNVGIACARAGFVGVVCNYRLQPLAQSWREQVDDVAAAVAWARRSADRFGGDADRLFLVGHSAGAHLVSSLLSDAAALERHGVGPDTAAAAIRGAVLLGGVFDVPRLARLPVGGLQVARAAFGERGSGAEWAAASPSKVLRAVGRRAAPSDVAPWEAAAADASGAGREGQGREPGAGGATALAAASRDCPLLTVPTLLVNAADDFHLDGDGASLVRAMRLARQDLLAGGTAGPSEPSRGDGDHGAVGLATAEAAAAPGSEGDGDEDDDAATDDEHGCVESWWEESAAPPGRLGIGRLWDSVVQRLGWARDEKGGWGAPASSAIPDVELPEAWRRWNVDPDRLAARVAAGLRGEASLLEARIARARRGPVVREFSDKTDVPSPLLDWGWLVPPETGAQSPSETVEARVEGEAGRAAADAGSTRRTVWGGQRRPLRLHAQPGTASLWSQADHRNHITLVGLIGQRGDPTTAAIEDFVRQGAEEARGRAEAEVAAAADGARA